MMIEIYLLVFIIFIIFVFVFAIKHDTKKREDTLYKPVMKAALNWSIEQGSSYEKAKEIAEMYDIELNN